MLKFRLTNSMRARRAAEAQRLALEEKLKMEWAWKPMAAVMNEKETDLVYWVPPLYTSNLLTSFGSKSTPSSLSSTPSSSFRRNSLRRASLASQGSVRRKRLAKRRMKLSPSLSVTETAEEDSKRNQETKSKEDDDEIHVEDFEGVGEIKKESTTDDDKESGIQDEYLDSSLEYESQVPHPESLFIRPRRQSSRRQSKPGFPRFCASKEEKLKYVPALLKVIDKLAQVYLMPMKPNLNTLRRNSKVAPNSGSINRKPKRPSVKIYSVPPSQRNSVRRKRDSVEEDPQDPYYVITNAKKPFGRRSVKESKSMNEPRKSLTHIGLPTMSEPELQSAHLEMILKILANLYEEKLANQTTEIEHLKSRLQNQEKVIKNTAHLALDIKEQMRCLRVHLKFSKDISDLYNQRERSESELSVPYSQRERRESDFSFQSSQDGRDSEFCVPYEPLEPLLSPHPEFKNENDEQPQEAEDTTKDADEDKSEMSQEIATSYISFKQIFPIAQSEDEDDNSSSCNSVAHPKLMRTSLNIEVGNDDE